MGPWSKGKKRSKMSNIIGYLVNPTMNSRIIFLHVMMLTYECWAIPFRLAIMHRFHWIDVGMDSLALVTLTHGVLLAVFTDYERSM